MKIAFLGLGIIGSAWARNLIADGHELRCWNRTPKHFPGFISAILEAIDGAEVIFVVVADPSAVQSILDQIVPSLAPGVLVIQSSTISARWTLRFAEQVQAAGALYLEAPFTGSRIAATKRQTVYYLGGDAATVDRARPLLEPISNAILHIGPLGSASTLKLAMNMNIAGVAQGLCESLALCRAAGIDDDIYFAALARNVSHSGLADLKEPKLRRRDYSPQFSLKHMAKDLRLARETAAELSLPVEQTTHVTTLYNRAMAAGWGEDDFIGLMRLQDTTPPRRMRYPRVLTIAGSDSCGGAGIQADLKTFAANGCYGMSAITALTAQNTVGVFAIHPVPVDFVRAQLHAVLSDIGADAVKIGMLYSPELIAVVAEQLKKHEVRNIVLDPVMVAQSGGKLLQDEAVSALKELLVPMADILTPNLPEASVLLGREITSVGEMTDAAVKLSRLGCPHVLIKGGHLESGDSDDCLYLAAERRCLSLPGVRIATRNNHGTGCTLSSAIAAFLARGETMESAVRHAKEYITAAIRAGADYSLGHGHGPVHHFFNYS